MKTRYSLVMATVVAAVSAIGTPLCASETDNGIESSFKNSYVRRIFLQDDTVKAEAKNGVVTLTGTVAEEYHKTLAQYTVQSLPGVISVDNQLVTKAEAVAANADTRMGKQTRLALLLHRDVSFRKTTVVVKDGVVTLTGIASSIAQKDLTSEYAKDIEGVKSVNNEMTVAATPELAERTPGEKLDDASITAQVRTALWAHRSTSSVKAKVETRNGLVILTGIAGNSAEKSLVTKLVTDIQGVTSVKNQMTVEEIKTK